MGAPPSAHIIRRPSTNFHRACADISARSRWCLTGTPIQNRLEDIGALFMFLRAEPFNMMAQFRRYISVPFEQGGSVARDRLILLYDSLVLRRTKDILVLPDHMDSERRLELRADERAQYEHTEKIVNRYMRQQVGRYQHQSKFGLFQANLQLRILCNHGTFQLPFSWKRRNYKDEKEAIIGELGLNAETLCSGCHQPRPIIGSNSIYNKFVEKCKHILCAECLEDCGDDTHCPLCRVMGKSARTHLGDGDGDTTMADADDDETHGHKHTFKYFRDVGYSSKMEALMEDLKRDVDETKR